MRKTKKKFHIIPVLGIALLAVTLFMIGGEVYGKYVKTRTGTGAVKAKPFYFISDLLTKEGAEYTLSYDTTQVSFILKNYADSLRITEDEISYTVTVTGGGDLGTDPHSDTTTLEGKLAGGSNSDDMVITLSELIPGTTYTITAVGEAGYIEKLSAVFTVSPDKTNVYKHVAYTDHEVLLTVWTENVSGEVLISFPKEGLIPDTTSGSLVNLWNLQDGVYKHFTNYPDALGPLGANTTRTYRFFKASDFAADVFTVTVGGKTAVDSTPP